MAKKIQITETVLRDAHQSLIATRMPLSDMLPILPQLDEIGFYSLECWGGATFDSCIRFLNEDPWERLRVIRKNCPKTKLQMLFRGQNMLGYRHYADDVLEYFVQRSVANGIDVIRIFDALNDIKNLSTAIKAAKAAKKENPNVEAQVAISYTTGPIFTTQYYVDYAKRIEEAGADSSMCLLKAIENGCDRIDTAMSPLANGTSHAPTESMVAALQGTEYDTGIDLVKLSEIREYFMGLREKYIKSGLLDPKMLAADAKALIYQVPGGMLSNLLKQLKDAGKADKLTEVLEEVPKVRKDAGYPPLVTPTSQIVGTQAVFNVLFGKYKNCSGQFKDLVAGKYGTTPVPIDPEFRKKIIGDEKPVTCRPADLLEPELEKLRAEIPQWIEQEEDVLTYAQFPQVAPKFFKARRDARIGINPEADLKNKLHPV